MDKGGLWYKVLLAKYGVVDGELWVVGGNGLHGGGSFVLWRMSG